VKDSISVALLGELSEEGTGRGRKTCWDDALKSPFNPWGTLAK